jgi:hypothetical protein
MTTTISPTRRPTTYYDPIRKSHLAPEDKGSVTVAIAIQEGRELKPGYTEDPFEPLLQVDPDLLEENPFAQELVELAREIQNDLGNEFDWIESLDTTSKHLKHRLLSWYEIALYAYKVKIQNAYRKQYKSFREWCQQALGCTVAAINVKIRAARALSTLIAQGFTRLPQSAAVAHELAKLQPDELAITWARITHQFADHEIKAITIVEFLTDPLTKEQPQFKKANVDFTLYQQLRETAAQAGVSPQKFLNQILADYFKTDERLPILTETETPLPTEPMGTGNKEGENEPPDPLPEETRGPVYGSDSNAQIATLEQGSLLQPIEKSESFELIAQANRIAYESRKQLAQAIVKEQTRNFLIDAPWGELAQELGKEPKEIFGKFKTYLVQIAKATGKTPDHAESWAGVVANGLFKNPGSELNCKYWEEFKTQLLKGETPTVKSAIASAHEWAKLAKELGYISKFNPETNTAKVPGEGEQPVEIVQKRYSLDYLKKCMERTKK